MVSAFSAVAAVMAMANKTILVTVLMILSRGRLEKETHLLLSFFDGSRPIVEWFEVFCVVSEVADP